MLITLSLWINRRVRRLTNLRVPGLYDRINKIAALIVRQERTLHRINRDLLEIVQRQTKSLRSRRELLRHGGTAHQPVSGVERDPKFLLIKNPKRMLRQARRGPGMDIAKQANFQRNSFIKQILRQVA